MAQQACHIALFRYPLKKDTGITDSLAKVMLFICQGWSWLEGLSGETKLFQIHGEARE